MRTNEQIADARRHVGYRLPEVRPDPPARREADPELYADLSGVARGYAADLVAGRLDGLGAADYLVEVSGGFRAKGLSHHGRRPWRVGIEAPDPDAVRVFLRVDLADRSAATSGDYRQFSERDGRRYSHEIDTRAGAGPRRATRRPPPSPTRPARTPTRWRRR